MAQRVCYHCKQPIDPGAHHDCWTTTEAALTAELTPELQDAWERLRETAVELGEQRIYASHNSIMFSRTVCHMFVRPKRSFLELTIFLGRPVNAPQIRRVRQSSRTKWTHVVHIRHRDEVEAPITGWMREAYQLQDKERERVQRREPRERSAPAKRRARERAGESDGQSPSAKTSTASRARTRARRSTASRSGRARRRGRR